MGFFRDTTTSNLQYLDIDQSLADLRRIIEAKKRKYGLRTKVIVAGGSYAGTMAAWMRYKYPLHVDGAWASCAPVEARTDFFGYKEMVGHAYRKEGGDECYNLIQDGFAALQDLINKGDTKRIEQEFAFCYPLNASNVFDVTNFYYGVQNMLSGQIQSAKPGSTAEICDYMTHSFWPDPLAGLAAFFRLAYGTEFCYYHFFDGDIQYGLDTTWTGSASASGYRTWIFQTCDQFGWFQTAGTSKNQPYGDTVPVSFTIEICRRLFGNRYNSLTVPLKIAATNLKYRGISLATSNIYWTHGELDPWIAGGIQSENNPLSPVDIIPGAPHTTELLSIYPDDTDEMVAVKKRAKELMLSWC